MNEPTPTSRNRQQSDSRSREAAERQALCCDCGNVRTYREGHAPRRPIYEGGHLDPDRHREMHAKAVAALEAGDTRNKSHRDYWARHADPFERLTCDFKCTACGKVTRHAIVQPAPTGDGRDPSEASDHGWELVWTGQRQQWRHRDDVAPDGATDASVALEALGVTVVEVPGLKNSVVLVRDQRVALMQPDLDAATREWALGWLLQQAAGGAI